MTQSRARATIVACALALSLSLGAAQPSKAQQPPRRVVSMNLCTDQLAMLIAAEGQLHSVSYLARDPQASSMADAAAGYRINHGQAEEIALLKPDLVLAGKYTTRVTVDMLRRLGRRVEIFEPENSIADIRRNILKMGEVLQREQAARALLAIFDADLAALPAQPSGAGPRTALFYASGFTSGQGSLADDILRHAGLTNIAPELGLPAGGILTLEQLILSGPRIVLRGQNYAGHSRGQEMLSHPALRRMIEGRLSERTTPDWTCGTPFTIAAIARLAAAARPEMIP